MISAVEWRSCTLTVVVQHAPEISELSVEQRWNSLVMRVKWHYSSQASTLQCFSQECVQCPELTVVCECTEACIALFTSERSRGRYYSDDVIAYNIHCNT